MSLFVKIAGQLAVGVRRECLSPGKVRLILPWGFPYEAFGSNVAVKPWHILSLVESGRALTFNRIPNFPDPFLIVEDLYTNYGLFMGSARLTITKEMYDITLPKTPLTLEKALVYVGKSTMNVHTDVLLPSQDLILARDLTLASCAVQAVLVDRQTRRPSPFPDWWRERFGSFSASEQQLKVSIQKPPQSIKFENDVNSLEELEAANHPNSENKPRSRKVHRDLQDLPITECVTSFNMLIASSEVDTYGHINWASFLKFCWDAMVMGSRSEVRASLQSHALKSADICFVREGSAGQRVKVKFWKDRDVPRAVHFNIVDSQSDELINYALLTFYSLQEVTLPVARL